MGILPASVRVGLRNKDVKKAGKAYGWNSKEEMEKVAAKLRAEVAAPKKAPAKKKTTTRKAA